MKQILFGMFLLFSFQAVIAQSSFNAKTIDASAVPQIVKDAQQATFPNQTVNRWSIQTVKGKRGNTGSNYIATFKTNNYQTRARYTAGGQGVVSVIFYGAYGLPQAIQTAATENYPGFTLTKGEKLTELKTAKFVYRVHLRKSAQRLTVYLDENGMEISKDSLPQEVQEEPAS